LNNEEDDGWKEGVVRLRKWNYLIAFILNYNLRIVTITMIKTEF